MKYPWSIGDQIVLREVWKERVWSGKPVTVAVAERDHMALYLAEGTLWQQPRTPDDSPVTPSTRLEGRWILRERVHHVGSNLLIIPHGASYSIQLMWSPRQRIFQGWYINLQDPLRQSGVGFDYMDWLLDVVVAPDLSEWHWKDEDELEEAQSIGLISSAEARCIREAGMEALDLLLSRKPPLDRDWVNWKPDPAWTVPELAHGWDSVEFRDWSGLYRNLCFPYQS